MSTYTDLHNRVKENITVDYNNRITPQRVRFYNEQNEYWGTLRGHVSAENINIAGGSLSGVTLVDTILKGSVALPDGIDLHKVLQQVKQISADLIETTENLDQEKIDRIQAVETEIDNREKAVSAESFARELKDFSLSTAVDQTNKDLKREISTLNVILTSQDNAISTLLSTDLTTERNERSIADSTEAYLRKTMDDQLSSAIVDSRADFGREVFDRTLADEKLELSIANEVKRSIERDEELSLALSSHNIDNNNKFANLCLDMLTTVERERHYSIYDGGTTKLTDSWPYDCKDFAVNIYNPTINNGAVFYNDKEGVRYEIGNLYKINSENLYPFNFKTLKNIQNYSVASALADNHVYGFDVDKKSQRTLMNGYTITFNDLKTTGQLSDYTFTVAPTLPQFHKMMYGNLMVGKVTDAEPIDYCEDILSGKIWFDTLDSELETFNKFRKVSFNKTDLSTHTKLTERITYLGENKFKLEKNIDRAIYIGIYDILNPEHYQFGRIYDTYNNISGIIYDNGEISEINVLLSNPYKKLVSLNKNNGFRNIVEEDVKFGDIYYNTILSATVDNTNAIFDLVKVSELYQYTFEGIDSSGKKTIGGYVIPKKYNKTIIESLDFELVDVNISNVMWIDAFKKTFTLSKSTLDSLWTVEESDDDNNVINIKFNGTTLYIKTTSGTDGSVVYQEHVVDIKNPTIFNVDSCHTHVYTTTNTELNEYTEVFESPQATYEITVNSDVSSEDFPRYELGIDTEFTGTLKIKVPERTSLDISREFLVVINPDCYTDQLVKLEFVDANGNPVKMTSKRRNMLLVPTNKWTTLQVKEINHNVFLVVDIDENEQNHDIEFLSNAVDIETELRISNDNYISTELNLSVDSLQLQILSNDADIADIYEKIKGGINYKGVVYGQLKDSSGNIVDIPTISNLFVWNKHHYSINEYTEDTVLSNGFMYIFKTFTGSDKSKFIIDGIDIEDRDYVIINCRSTDINCNGKAIKDLTSADIDIVDAEDADVIHRPELTQISAFLSDEIVANNNDIEYLSSEVSTIQFILLSGFNFLSSNIDYVSTEVSCNDSDIDYLSGNVKYLLSVDSETMNYKKTLPYLPNLIDDIDGTDLGYNYLSAFILQYIGINEPMNLKLGDLFRLSATLSCLYDANHNICWLGAKDYFVINKDCVISNILIEDLDIFRNAEAEFEWLSTALSTDINNLSTALSTDIDNLSTALSTDIDNLSTSLSTDIDNLSTSLSTTTKLSVEELQRLIINNDNDISYISTEVSCNDNDIEFLSATLSTSIRRDLSAIRYFGNVLLSDTYDFEGIAELTSNTLFGLIKTNMYTFDPDKEIRAGFAYRTSGDINIIYEVSSDNANISRTLRNNEFIIVNKNINKLSNISINDIEVIKDYDLSVKLLQNQIILNDNDISYISNEVSCNDNDINFLSGQHDWLSTALSTDIDNLSTALSTTTKLSVEELQRQVISNDKDIEFLSGQHDWLSTALSTDIDNLSTALSTTTKLSVEELQRLIINNDNDIEFLSNDLSTLEYKHYNKTLSNDITFTLPGHPLISATVDQLLIKDEITFDLYRLTIRNGALNINLVEKYEIK